MIEEDELLPLPAYSISAAQRSLAAGDGDQENRRKDQEVHSVRQAVSLVISNVLLEAVQVI